MALAGDGWNIRMGHENVDTVQYGDSQNDGREGLDRAG